MAQDTSKQMGQLESLMQHPGWAVLKEDLVARKTALLDQLALLKRPDGASDDFIRGRVDMAKFVLSGYEQMVKVAKAQKYLSESGDGEDIPSIGSPFDPAGIDSPPTEE